MEATWNRWVAKGAGRKDNFCFLGVPGFPKLDCYWVGSLDFNFLIEIKGSATKPTKSETFCRGVNSNQVNKYPTRRGHPSKRLTHTVDGAPL